MNNILQLFSKYGAYLALGSLLIFIIPKEYEAFGEIGWILLLVIMFSKPISDVFPKIPGVRKILPVRRQLGIICASLIIAHGVGAYMVGWRIDGGTFTNFSDFLLWGILGGIVALPLLATSNNIAVRLLKKRWKLVQRLAYFMFIFGALHIYFIQKEIGILILLGVWIVLKILAAKKIILWKK